MALGILANEWLLYHPAREDAHFKRRSRISWGAVSRARIREGRFFVSQGGMGCGVNASFFSFHEMIANIRGFGGLYPSFVDFLTLRWRGGTIIANHEYAVKENFNRKEVYS